MKNNSHNDWSKNETSELISNYQKGMTYRQISKLIGRSDSAVESKLLRLRKKEFKNRLQYRHIKDFIPRDFRFPLTNLSVIATMIWWAEGTKRCQYGVEICNTNPDLIRMFLKFFRTLPVIEKKISLIVYIFEDQNKNSIYTYWKELLQIERIKMVVMPIKKDRKRFTIMKFGRVVLRYYSKNLFYCFKRATEEIFNKYSCGIGPIR